MVERGGFEPPKAKPTDLQSAPFGRSGTSPIDLTQFISIKIITKKINYHYGRKKVENEKSR
jgi:hypothetical protein